MLNSELPPATTIAPQAAGDHFRRARLLALDVGDRRTGVAISDELALYAHPRPAILARSRQELLQRVIQLIAAEEVAEVIVGLPLSMSGSSSAQTDHVRSFARDLRGSTPVPVVEVDERLSTREAAAYVHGREARKSGLRDSAAAAIVLQAVLDGRRGVRE